MQPHDSSPKTGYRFFPVCECAFLRAKEDADGVLLEAKCLMKHGQECSCAAEFPSGLPCKEAVRRSTRRKETDKHYWDSLRKHHLKQSEKTQGKNMRHSKLGNSFSALGTPKQEFRFCKRKKRYADQKQAEENRKWCEAKRGVPLRIMFCPYCNGYHLTRKYAAANRLFDDTDKQAGFKREIEARAEKKKLERIAEHSG